MIRFPLNLSSQTKICKDVEPRNYVGYVFYFPFLSLYSNQVFTCVIIGGNIL